MQTMGVLLVGSELHEYQLTNKKSVHGLIIVVSSSITYLMPYAVS